jgi:glucokinase
LDLLGIIRAIDNRMRISGMLLGGDIGGTKTLLALATEEQDGGMQIILERSYASREYPTFDNVLAKFRDEARVKGYLDPIEAACIGVAGPVDAGRAKVTYLPWQLDAIELGSQIGGAPMHLLNDFATAAAGLLDPTIPVQVLQSAPAVANGTRVILGAGTGLGVAALTCIGEQWKIVSGEGGHTGFAPADQEQTRLREWLAARNPRVTAERILSGAGLVDLYRFVCAEESGAAADIDLANGGIDPAAAVATGGLAHPESAAGHALRLFCSVYGAFAGDLALLFNARGGVFLAGGIAPKILAALRGPAFVTAFRDKGVHSLLVDNYPAQVVMEPRLGLLGALQLAAGRGIAEN